MQNLLARRAVRGASTITEQVVRMLHPRPRTIWSRWLEGFEAAALERRFSKAAILEFYLNQAPYARQRRGVLQAARLYFGRDLDTLSLREMLALVVLVRAPGSMDLMRGSPLMERAAMSLAKHLLVKGHLDQDGFHAAVNGVLRLQPLEWHVDAGHFVQHLLRIPESVNGRRHGRLASTLDRHLQVLTQDILDRRLKDLDPDGVSDGAVLVVDHRRDEILAWVNGGGLSGDRPGGWIDAVTTPRQPGSTLKPFLYALAMEKGWTAATRIEDAPLAEAIGSGLHSFRNYSGAHYGWLRLRDALGNSLNIPALRAIRFTGASPFLERLHELGLRSLDRSPDFYGEGLALGDGEVSLLELVGAYAVLARGGELRPLRMVLESEAAPGGWSRRVIDEGIASVIGSILSDPEARRLEFGAGHILSLPVQTAVKTGTSSDHRDAWAVGFSSTHTVGVWMGNLDRRPTRSVTGTTGPGLVLRSVFAELNRGVDSRPLPLSPHLERVSVCRLTGLRAGARCPRLDEWFLPATSPREVCAVHPLGVDPRHAERRSVRPESDALTGVATVQEARDWGPVPSRQGRRISLVQPTEGLRLAMDPHVPDSLEAFSFLLPRSIRVHRTEWLVNGTVAGETGAGAHGWLWRVVKGTHTARARVWLEGETGPVETAETVFEVR